MGAKWETEWQGYKVHLTETVSPDGPQLIRDVQSDVAPATDREVLTEIQERLQERQLPPDQHLVDSGYMTPAIWWKANDNTASI
jgi:hypothetical protein